MHNWRSTRGNAGIATRMIEEPALPADTFLWFAAGAILGSLALQISGRRDQAMFVGQWVPTLLILGVYNRLAKLLGRR